MLIPSEWLFLRGWLIPSCVCLPFLWPEPQILWWDDCVEETSGDLHGRQHAEHAMGRVSNTTARGHISGSAGKLLVRRERESTEHFRTDPQRTHKHNWIYLSFILFITMTVWLSNTKYHLISLCPPCQVPECSGCAGRETAPGGAYRDVAICLPTRSVSGQAV